MPKFQTEDSDKPNDAKLMNDFGYPRGDTTCPLPSHIRKTNQRRRFGDNNSDNRGPRTRIIRNGIPYGTDYKADGSDKSKRGLLFACYQGHIEDGFQNMQAGWCNSRNFPAADAGHDPIVGQVPQKSRKVNGMLEAKISDVNGEDQTVKVQQFVTLKGGEYFFVPSIKALTHTLSNI
jgi:deferrochelatase/peroxidase EfeB